MTRCAGTWNQESGTGLGCLVHWGDINGRNIDDVVVVVNMCWFLWLVVVEKKKISQDPP